MYFGQSQLIPVQYHFLALGHSVKRHKYQSNNAERKAPRRMTHEEMTTKMISQLKLNDAQKTKVAALNKEYQAYLMPEPPQGKGPDKNGEKPDMKKSGNKKPGTNNHQGKRQEYEKKLKKILTDDQYKSYQNMGHRGKENLAGHK